MYNYVQVRLWKSYCKDDKIFGKTAQKWSENAEVKQCVLVCVGQSTLSQGERWLDWWCMRWNARHGCQSLKLLLPAGDDIFRIPLTELLSPYRRTKETVAFGGDLYTSVAKQLLGKRKLTLLHNEPHLYRVREVSKCWPTLVEFIPPLP